MLSSRSNQRAVEETGWQVPAVGFGVWIAWLLVAQPLRTPGLLMLSPFVIVPLVLQLVIRSDAGEQRLLQRTRLATVPAALVAALSFSFEQGVGAMVLTLPWLALTVIWALEGVLRILGRRELRSAYLGFDQSLIYIVVGGAWLAISRLGLTLGFTAPIVELTAVHFHYAGHALPAVVAALGAHRFGSDRAGAKLPIAVHFGIVGTALGITWGGVLEWIGATAMAIVGIIIAIRLLQFARTVAGIARVLFAIAGVTLTGGMIMALIWAWTVWLGVDGPGLDRMVATHGGMNAIGFGLLAVIGFTLVGVPVHDERRSLRLGRPSSGELEALAAVDCPATIDHPEVFGEGHPEGWRRDNFDRAGPNTFDDAVVAMKGWGGHKAAGIKLAAEPPIQVGQHVALAIPFFGIASVTAKAEIAQIIDEPGRYGFAYQTTGHHPMDGIEAFVIEEAGVDGVTESIPVVWKPAILGARICPPLTRWLQRQALDRYLNGIVGPGAAAAS